MIVRDADLGRSAGFGAAFGDEVGDMINAQVAEMVQIDKGLYASATSASLRERVDNWHSSAVYWMQLADTAAQDPAKLAEWQKVGVEIAQNAQEYAREINDDRLLVQTGHFLATFPSAVQQTLLSFTRGVGTVAREVAHEAGEVVGEAGKSLGGTFLWLAVAVAGGIFLLSKAGLGLDLPFLKVRGR